MKVNFQQKQTTMKHRSISTLCLLSFALVACSDPDPVVDTLGNNLEASSHYYILPVIRGRGGGLTLGPRGSSCPLHVIQERQEIKNGLPLTFSPVNGASLIPLSTDLNVMFAAATTCVQSTVWKLDSRWFVTTGGVKGNPGRQTVSNWFKIEKFDSDYKLRFCPTVCDICKVVCRDVGISIDQAGNRSLFLSDTPFKVMFKKA